MGGHPAAPLGSGESLGMPPPRSSPGRRGGTHMSLAGRFLPSTMRMERALRRAMAGGQRSRAEPSGAKRRRARPRTRGPEHSAHVRTGIGAHQSARGGGGRRRGLEGIRGAHWVVLSTVGQGVWPPMVGGAGLPALPGSRGVPPVSPLRPRPLRCVPAVPAGSPLCPRCVPAGSPLCPLGPLSPRRCPRFQGSSAPACLAQRPPVLDQTYTELLRPHEPGGCSISRAALHPKPPAFY